MVPSAFGVAVVLWDGSKNSALSCCSEAKVFGYSHASLRHEDILRIIKLIDIHTKSTHTSNLLPCILINMFAIILEPIINSPAACLLFIFSSFLIVQLLKSFHSYFLLRHIPGPFWAHFTGLWLSLQLWRGGDFAEICGKLTEKYGPVVRFGPKNVVVGDPSVIPIIYSTTHPWRKVRYVVK